ncbi:hypothetical protein [Nocardia niigatensis]
MIQDNSGSRDGPGAVKSVHEFDGGDIDTSGIAELATVVEALSNSVLHANLDAFADSDVVELMQRVETCKRQLSALDSRLIIEACDRSLPKGGAAKDVVPFLRQTLGLDLEQEGWAHARSPPMKSTPGCPNG